MRAFYILFFLVTVSVLNAQVKPNIILILTDDQGYGDFGFTGNPFLETPNIDKLKAESVSFNNYFTPSICAPTRAGIMTGRFHYRTGVTDTYQSRVNMFPEEVTIAEYLKTANYATGSFGKWHLGYNFPLRAMDQGFDEDLMWEEMQDVRVGPEIMENGKEVKYPKQAFLTDIIFDKASEFITAKAKEKKSFFAYIATYLPHTHPNGKQVPDEYVKKYNHHDISWHTKDVYGMISKVDERIGKLIDKIEKLGIARNTVIVFTSDNGPQPGSSGNQGRSQVFEPRYNAGLRGFKNQMYDGGIKVPLLVRLKGKFEAGKQVNRLVTNLDILPTILEISNVKSNQKKPLDGISFLPLIDSYPEKWPNERKFIYHFSRGEHFIDNKYKNYCIRTERYKMVNGNQLYDLYSDPSEKNNIAKENKILLNEMNNQFGAWFDDVTSWYGNVDRPANGIGYPEQKVTTLYYFKKIPNLGWPIDIAKTKTYSVFVEDINHNLFGDDSYLCISINNKIYQEKNLGSGKAIEFKNLELNKGRCYFNVFISGTKRKKEWRYQMEDEGYRKIRIY